MGTAWRLRGESEWRARVQWAEILKILLDTITETKSTPGEGAESRGAEVGRCGIF